MAQGDVDAKHKDVIQKECHLLLKKAWPGAAYPSEEPVGMILLRGISDGRTKGLSRCSFKMKIPLICYEC